MGINVELENAIDFSEIYLEAAERMPVRALHWTILLLPLTQTTY